MTALGSPVLLGAAGMATDYAYMSMKQSEMQGLADASAIAATRELSLAKSPHSVVESVAKSYVTAGLQDPVEQIQINVEIDDDGGSVKVDITNSWQPFFAHYLKAGITPIVVSSKAELVGEQKVCVIALTPSGMGGVAMTNNSHLSAKGCAVYSNSTHSSGFYLGDNSTIEADLVCSAGGVVNRGGSTSTEMLTDCPRISNPLAGRVAPSTGGCDYNDLRISSGTRSLSRGVYCGGIIVSGDARVTFEPGTHVMKNGLFVVTDKASIKGTDVSFYLTGAMSMIHFLKNATIDLSGAKNGDQAGLLFHEDPASSTLRIHSISATNAHTLTGTIYLPKGTLTVDPAAPVGQNSAYTALVVYRLVVQNGPRLTLNSDYEATDVPVPSGIRASADVVLAN